jgi:hypothetical protein
LEANDVTINQTKFKMKVKLPKEIKLKIKSKLVEHQKVEVLSPLLSRYFHLKTRIHTQTVKSGGSGDIGGIFRVCRGMHLKFVRLKDYYKLEWNIVQ